MNLDEYSGRRRRSIAEMNVVPFIDVMLVLLVIFMITTPLLTQGVKIDLPHTTNKALPTNQDTPLIVTVDAKGDFYLNIAEKPNQPITTRVLTNLVTTQLQASNNDATKLPRAVLVRGDKNANYGKIVEAMVILQHAGAKSVGLITQPEQRTTTN
jgi:biopolymer transport protein TolR